MSKYKLVVFDMAGTTVHDRGNVADAFIAAFADAGIAVERAEVKKVMGWRKKDAIRILLEKYKPAEINDETINRIHDAFIHKMIEFYRNDTEIRPLPFAEELFGQLRQEGIKVALNTGFTRAITDTILTRLNWQTGRQIDYVIASDEVDEGRPSPSMIKTIMKALSISDPASIVKLGDTEVDVQEGRNAGCGLVISVTTGAYTREQLEAYHPDHIIDSLSQLSSLIS